MFATIDGYLIIGILVGGACGFESLLVGRGLAIATHVVAVVCAYTGLAASDMAGAPAYSLESGLVYAMALLFLILAWLAESDALQTSEAPRDRNDASNHIIAFVAGLACAMRSDAILVLCCAQMAAVFLHRARTDCQPADAAGGSLLSRRRRRA